MHLHPSETTQLHPPPEICALICGLVDRETLLHLGKVSRVFHHQAQRGIYHTVDLRPGPSEAFISWCRAVSRDPQLGVYLHSLTLCAPTVEESERLAHVLNNCPNLKRLAVLSRSSSKSYEEDHRDSCHTWATDKAPFRLTHLADYSGKTFMSAFWNTQTEIRLLSLPSREKQVFPCHEDQLPNLVALEVASTDGLPMTARPIERIQLRQHHPKNFEVFRRFSASLTTLNLCGLRDIISTIMNLLCYELPNLLHLGIAQDPAAMFRLAPFPHIPLTMLTRLKSFVLYANRVGILFDSTTGRNYALSDPQSVADHVMELCPSLDEVIIGGYNEREVDGKRVGMEETCKLTRNETTREVSVELGKGYDFDAVGRFWDA